MTEAIPAASGPALRATHPGAVLRDDRLPPPGRCEVVQAVADRLAIERRPYRDRGGSPGVSNPFTARR